MFKEIKIENFRAFKSFKFENLKKLNLVIGENNCGKTNLLESLYLCINPYNSLLPQRINNFRGFIIGKPDFWKSLFYRFNTDRDIVLSCEMIPFLKRTLRIKPIEKIEGGFAPESNNGEKENIKSSSSLIPSIIGLELETFLESENKKFKSSITLKKEFRQGINPALRGQHIEPYNIEIPEDYSNPINGYLLNPETIYFNLSEKFGEIVKEKEKDRIIKLMQKFEPSLENMELIDNIIHFDFGYSPLIPIHALGDGTRKILGLALYMMTMKGVILLIDEIENGLHYKTLRIMWDFIFKSLKQYDIQLIASTHSLDCIRAFVNSAPAEFDDLNVFRIERKKNDNYKVITYNKENVNIYLDNEWEIR